MLFYGVGVLQDDRQVTIGSGHLSDVADRAEVPAYDRSALERSIVHIGVGGFHRAHLATYIDDLARLDNDQWSIVGAGILPGDVAMAAALGGQDHLYTLISRGAESTDLRVIGSIVDFVLADRDAEPLIERIADPVTQIVSMTVTEAGYPVDDVTGEFVASQSAVDGTFAVLVDGLARRRAAGAGPLTVLSCDNIMTNGRVARAATLGEAGRRGGDLAAWIDANVSFPNSMVDRITPATTDGDREQLANEYGIVDAWPVVAEPFRQWVIEDDFAGRRLPLEDLDVIVTDDIDPYELTKLRLLNAGHSCLAYLAALDGFGRVDVAMADPGLRNFVTRLLHDEAKPTLPAAAGIDLDDYIASLIERFSNPGVGDQIERLCLDGSAKFPKFLLPTIRAQLVGDVRIERSALALAGWCEYLRTAPSPASDPLLATAIEHAEASLADPSSFLGFYAVFDDDLAGSAILRERFVASLSRLRDSGVQFALAAIA